jgi:hypothetical protein
MKLLGTILSTLWLGSLLSLSAAASELTGFALERYPNAALIAHINNSGICFSDMASFARVKGQLPGSLQNPPIYATHQSWDLTGGLRIMPVGNRIQLDAHINSTFAGVINQSTLITQACVDGDQMAVTLASGQSQTIQVGDSSLTIKGYEFDLTDSSSYQSVVSQVPAH